jgi:hypothetical protein
MGVGGKMTWHIAPDTDCTVRNDRHEVQCVCPHPDIAARIVADHGAVAELADLRGKLRALQDSYGSSVATPTGLDVVG